MVTLIIEVDCCDDCPFNDADESYNVCEKAGRSLPLRNDPDKNTKIPKWCPFRKTGKIVT